MAQKRKSSPTKMVSLRLPVETADWAQQQAKQQGTTLTRWLIGRVCEAHQMSMVSQQIAQQMDNIARRAAHEAVEKAAAHILDAHHLGEAMVRANDRIAEIRKMRQQQR